MRPLLAVTFAGLGACAPPTAALPYPAQAAAEGEPVAAQSLAPTDVVRYFEREVALEPFLAGFPYGEFEASVEHGRLFYLDRRERYTLRMLRLPDSGALDPSRGEAVSSVDWSTRGLFGLRYHAPTDSVWVVADERNDEKLSLYAISLSDGELTRMTQTEYLYGFGFSENGGTVAYLPRTGSGDGVRACLHVLDVGSREDRKVVCDQPALRFTWSRPLFSPDDQVVYFNAQVDGDRNRVQLVAVDLRAKTPTVVQLTDPRRPRTAPHVLDGWMDGELLMFTANDDGYRNLYSYSPKRKQVRQVTRYREDVGGAVLTEAGVFLAHGTPAGTTLELVDPRSGERRTRGGVNGSVEILDGFDRQVLWTHSAPDVVFQLNRTRLEPAPTSTSMTSERLIQLDPELENQLVACRAQAVKIPTFDVDPSTGKTRELHAFLLRPARPVPEARRLGLVRAFYGGDNVYERFDNILCAAGMTVLSPSVRGSSGFGREFAALNDRDLGGKEIIDLFHAGRWLEQAVGLSADRIGVYGRSHGGYATLRALTFPSPAQGADESYRFGFGMAEAGFSDIEAFYAQTNIPDWVVLEAGDPKVPAQLERIRDRSPIHHVERLAVPLLLLHGANDWRVPVEGSRAFAEKAALLGKPVTYVEVEGQGHHIEGLARVVATWQARFDFMMSLPALGDGQAAAGMDRSDERGKGTPKDG